MTAEKEPPTLDVPPDPAALIESMRAFGYSMPAAVADLIDNSISAGARKVEVNFRWAGAASSVEITDDGVGMDAHGLLEAMRLGSRSPTEVRASNDLGRFGLGLKSAAWSQARSLTVLSTTGGSVQTRRWDLDHVTASGTWSLLTKGSDLSIELGRRLEAQGRGTVVLLERPDRLVGDVASDDEDAHTRFLALARMTAEHLGMVFHRFLTGRAALSLVVGREPVTAWDPFLEEHPATQRLPGEALSLAGRRVSVAPFVLPHVSKLTPDEHRRAAGLSGWNAQQGFYVYRGRRLLVPGGWLGLKRMQREEHFKLARIRVDLDNDMDEAWQIDVRKATARIPGPLEDPFRRFATRTRSAAAEAYRFRGKTVARSERQEALAFVWQRARRRQGAHDFRVNRRHPLLARLLEDTGSAAGVERALRLVEENLPVEAIVMESRENPERAVDRPFEADQTTVMEMLRSAHVAMTGEGLDPRVALEALSVVEPFESYPELVQTRLEEIEG